MVGTGTEVGKTWVAARLLTDLRAAGMTVAARKPAQSFPSDDGPAGYDAAVLGVASGERPEAVCPPHRWYEVAMAPPMAAELLGRAPFTLDDLRKDLRWPSELVDVGVVETAGGVRSPLAVDADCLDLCLALEPDLVLLVADAGLGTISAVRLAAGVLTQPLAVVLNRFDHTSDIHWRNFDWLRNRDGMQVLTVPGGETELAQLVKECPNW